MYAKDITPQFLQRVILSLLLIATPYVMTFKPYEGIYTEGVWTTSFELDPLHHLRASLIVGGLLGAVLSIALLIWELTRKKLSANEVVSEMSMAICSLFIGWRSFPYWVNGMFQAYSGNARVVDFDPKALMPETWIGDLWVLGVVLINIIAFFAIPLLFVANLDLTIRARTWKRGIATGMCIAVTVAVFICSPNYLRWLMD